MQHREFHRAYRVGWLRAAVLGADDGMVSTASLLMGVAASGAGRTALLVAGVAGLVGGAMSMAAGEYVSVSSQRDAERADIELEQRELAVDADHELRELARIYERRGLDPDLARRVATAMHAHDALDAHVRDELGIVPEAMARPAQASVVSATSFAVGAAVPLVVGLLSGRDVRIALIAVATLVGLAGLGATGSRLGGAPARRGALRVAVGGAIAMAVTALIGRLVGIAI